MSLFMRRTLAGSRFLRKTGMADSHLFMFEDFAIMLWESRNTPQDWSMRQIARKLKRDINTTTRAIKGWMTHGLVKKGIDGYELTEDVLGMFFVSQNSDKIVHPYDKIVHPYDKKSHPYDKTSLRSTMKMSQRPLDQNRSEQNDSDSNESESRTLADASTIGSGIPEHKRVASEWLEQRLKQIELNKQKAKQKAKQEKEARDKQDEARTEQA